MTRWGLLEIIPFMVEKLTSEQVKAMSAQANVLEGVLAGGKTGEAPRDSGAAGEEDKPGLEASPLGGEKPAEPVTPAPELVPESALESAPAEAVVPPVVEPVPESTPTKGEKIKQEAMKKIEHIILITFSNCDPLKKSLEDKNYNLMLRQAASDERYIELFTYLLKNATALQINLMSRGKNSGSVWDVATKANNFQALTHLKQL